MGAILRVLGEDGGFSFPRPFLTLVNLFDLKLKLDTGEDCSKLKLEISPHSLTQQGFLEALGSGHAPWNAKKPLFGDLSTF